MGEVEIAGRNILICGSKDGWHALDNVCTHAYAKMLYKYPHAAFPYDQLVAENARRSRTDLEYELLDTGVFDGDRYFDVVIEYAKASPEDLCVRIEAFNRGPDPAPLHILPHLWFRNTWAWSPTPDPEPSIRLDATATQGLRLATENVLAARAVEGARTTAALAASYHGPVLKVSEDGYMTMFLKGRRVWEL